MKSDNSPQPIKLAYDSDCLDIGIAEYVNWEYHKYPNLLVLGNTGSGKSYALRLLLARIAKTIPDARAWVCDYKNEFMQADKEARYSGYRNVIEGFESFEEMFYERLEGEPDLSFRLLLIDEYVSWLNSMDKKEAEDIKKRMANLLFLVRSKNCHVILGCQRGMAENFTFGSRDCLNVIFLGAPSKESIRSFVTGEEAEIIQPQPIGRGYAVFDGIPPRAITIPTIKNMDNMNELLTDLITR